ncbi:MAG TPA: peptidoglycan editing factor PgeF [Polyangia bacterium]|nr:peptidoglycan editing factor PgeF [Polyangia bacterium]
MLPLLQSLRIGAGFTHGFTTRAGGVSAPPYDSLNLGGKWGDDPAHVTENRRRLASAVGGEPFVARQVHGTVIRRVHAGEERAQVARHEADGLCSDVPGVVLGVFVADCVPALLADPRTGACAAVHAGWRGTVAGILPEAVQTLAREFGARAADLRVVLGPAIGPCCFEVGLEVVDAVVSAIPDARERAIIRPSPRDLADKAHVDLQGANRFLLEHAGVPADAIDAFSACTRCDRERFFSFRRDGAATGQQMGVIALEADRPRL